MPSPHERAIPLINVSVTVVGANCNHLARRCSLDYIRPHVEAANELPPVIVEFCRSSTNTHVVTAIWIKPFTIVDFPVFNTVDRSDPY